MRGLAGTARAVVLEFTDAGVGMDPETVRHCFEKFWQADASGTRRFGGTGIGLYIVRSLTEAMGGTVAVRSELGAGTTFTLRLPAADAGSQHSCTHAGRRDPGPAAPSQPPGAARARQRARSASEPVRREG